MEEKNRKNDDRIIYAVEKMLEKLNRRDEIRDIISRALKNRTFEVYYQPIYNWKQRVFDSAEALIRLKDEKYGFISPDDLYQWLREAVRLLR